MKKNILFLTLLCAFSSAFAQVPSVSASTKWAVIDGNATWVPSALDLKNYCLLGFAGGTTGQVLTKNSGTDYDYSWAAGGGGASYLVYTALLTQSGTSAPTATVLDNTLGGAVTWGYTSDGTYDFTLPFATPTNKFVTIIGPASEGLGNNVYAQSASTGAGAGVVNTGVIGSSFLDDELYNTYFEIRVYP